VDVKDFFVSSAPFQPEGLPQTATRPPEV
jgi:hypothetical protein